MQPSLTHAHKQQASTPSSKPSLIIQTVPPTEGLGLRFGSGLGYVRVSAEEVILCISKASDGSTTTTLLSKENGALLQLTNLN